MRRYPSERERTTASRLAIQITAARRTPPPIAAPVRAQLDTLDERVRKLETENGS